MASTIINDYPYRNHAAKGCKPWGFARRQCTDFACWRVRSRTPHKDFTNWWKGLHFGNANQWHLAAQKAGIKVDTNPTVGCIAQRLTGTWGHVAYVAEVYPSGDYLIEEYNRNGYRQYGTRRIKKGSSDFQQFIHFETAQPVPKPATEREIQKAKEDLMADKIEYLGIAWKEDRVDEKTGKKTTIPMYAICNGHGYWNAWSTNSDDYNRKIRDLFGIEKPWLNVSESHANVFYRAEANQWPKG